MAQDNLSGVFSDIHKIEVVNKDIPTAGDDGIVVKVEKAGICGTDLHIYHSGMGGLIPKGSVLGHEFCGEIVEKGSNVKGVEIGDRVVVNPMYEATGLGGSPGGFSNYMKVNQAVLNHSIYKIPQSMNSSMAALIEPLTVALSAINASNLRAQENALVTGCGTIGLATIAGLKSKGIDNIIATDISDTRLELAKKLGAKLTFNPTKDGNLKDVLVEQYGEVDNLTYSGKLPHLTVAFECSGVSALLEETVQLLAPDSKLTILAVYGNELKIDPNQFVYKRLQILGSFFYKNEDFIEAIELSANGTTDLTPIITHEFPLLELSHAFEVQADSKQSIKVVVNCQP